MLLALSWDFLKLTISLLILFLSTGCPMIYEYSTNSLRCSTTASTWRLLSTWLNSWQFTNQPTSYALLLILPWSVFPLCAHTRLVRDLFFLLHRLFRTVSLSKLDHQTHSQSFKSHLFQLSCCLSLCMCVCVCACVHVCACSGKFLLTVFCSLLCGGLSAPIWRNSI